MAVETGDNVAIGGFIISGNSPKKVAVRGLGPSLQSAGISHALVDPILELRSADQSMIASNDNWRDNAASAAQLQANGLAPRSNLEAAIVATEEEEEQAADQGRDCRDDEEESGERHLFE